MALGTWESRRGIIMNCICLSLKIIQIYLTAIWNGQYGRIHETRNRCYLIPSQLSLTLNVLKVHFDSLLWFTETNFNEANIALIYAESWASAKLKVYRLFTNKFHYIWDGIRSGKPEFVTLIRDKIRWLQLSKYRIQLDLFSGAYNVYYCFTSYIARIE